MLAHKLSEILLENVNEIYCSDKKVLLNWSQFEDVECEDSVGGGEGDGAQDAEPGNCLN